MTSLGCALKVPLIQLAPPGSFVFRAARVLRVVIDLLRAHLVSAQLFSTLLLSALQKLTKRGQVHKHYIAASVKNHMCALIYSRVDRCITNRRRPSRSPVKRHTAFLHDWSPLKFKIALAPFIVADAYLWVHEKKRYLYASVHTCPWREIIIPPRRRSPRECNFWPLSNRWDDRVIGCEIRSCIFLLAQFFGNQ